MGSRSQSMASMWKLVGDAKGEQVLRIFSEFRKASEHQEAALMAVSSALEPHCLSGCLSEEQVTSPGN